MQIIKDLSIFTKQKARRLKANSKSMIYDAGGETVTQISLSDHPLLLKQPLHCRYVSRSILNKYFFQSRHRQKFLSLEYVLEGEMHVLCGNTGYILEAGDLALLHPGQKNCLLYLPEIWRHPERQNHGGDASSSASGPGELHSSSGFKTSGGNPCPFEKGTAASCFPENLRMCFGNYF